jgi:hypothetical protein
MGLTLKICANPQIGGCGCLTRPLNCGLMVSTQEWMTTREGGKMFYTAYIYGLEDPRTERVFYVGSSQDAEKRFKDHVAGHSGLKSVGRVVKELAESGLRPRLKILETVSISDQNSREMFWIRKLYEDGEPLVNQHGLIHMGQPVEFMESMTIALPSRHAEMVKQMAAERGVSKGAIIRELVSKALSE